ncbi:uncharacterized protein B0P05DRAFT_563798 [Gilbertella persicaria]|uniref:uncharacterized protein n=1 Tax=Gilbertella persicaria TaxID=101096 RepID=UPI0022208E81|nr:uncharacterized protein B0P05DRAFT_563798 [Gilbertella persicaria]KAI8049121.1 hypothetical protein B0P05DRAFT_563798 [Gilbertella persicaria]
MSVSCSPASNNSSIVSTPSSSSSTCSYPYYNQAHPIQPQQQFAQIQPHHQGGFRPLLPATTTTTSPPSTQFLPSLRMSGYEKIYGNVCRY